MIYLCHVNQVLSSILAAWADVNNVAQKLGDSLPVTAVMAIDMEFVSDTFRKLNMGYFWMLLNCLTSAAYVDALSLSILFYLLIY